MLQRKDVTEHGERFIPCTREITIGGGVWYRPLRSWHSNTYAGEGLTSVRGDGSGCLHEGRGAMPVASQPSTVTHRLYWHERNRERTISVFLSYPNRMGYSDGEYFWEAYGTGIEARWFGENAETEMEAAVLAVLNGMPLCSRCADQGEYVPATHDELCDSCHVSAGEAQDEQAARDQY